MWKLLGCLLLLPVTASAANMAPVEKTAGFCAANQETYCYEWALTPTDQIRFVAHGDEYTIEYSFYRVDTHGYRKLDGYRKLADVFPVLQDPEHPGRLFWGYPWDITDIRLTEVIDSPALLSTTNHGIKVSDEYGTPVSDEVRPAILFVGTATQTDSEVEPLNFAPVLLTDLGHEG